MYLYSGHQNIKNLLAEECASSANNPLNVGDPQNKN